MAVLKVDITSRKEYAEGQSFGSTGPYERIDGIVTFAVDPENTANASIVDLGLAPRDEEGLVQFSSDFTLLTPTESNGHGKLLVDVINADGRWPSTPSTEFHRHPRPRENSRRATVSCSATASPWCRSAGSGTSIAATRCSAFRHHRSR